MDPAASPSHEAAARATVATAVAVAASGARVLEAARLPAALTYATDTRALRPGDAFVALRGERFDGHGFAARAVALGAAALVVDDAAAVPPGVPALVVADTTAAYLAIAGGARAALRGRVAAITGSAGKTTTKALLAGILEAAAPGRVAATVANENNEIGVAKLLLAAPRDAAYVVVEFGARHYGEIAPLARAARPDVAVLTNVGDAHLEIMGSRERLAETKWGIFGTGAATVVWLRDATAGRAAGLGRPVVWFDAVDAPGPAAAGDGGSPVRFGRGDRTVVLAGRDRLVLADAAGESALAVDARIAGEHNLCNLAAAIAAAIALGLAPEAVAASVPGLALPGGRYERHALGGEVVAVFDAYNASMSGTLATLASFAREPAARRVAVLASMAELGPEAPAMHARVGAAAAASGLARLFVGGDFAGDLARGAAAAGLDPAHVATFASNGALAAELRAYVRPGDVLLFKGSRRYRLEDALGALEAALAPGAPAPAPDAVHAG